MASTSDLRLLQLHIEALYTHDAQGRLLYVNEPGGDRAPRFFFGRTRDGNLWRCRSDLAERAVRELEHLTAGEPVRADLQAEPRHLHDFLTALGTEPGSASSARQYSGPAYRFPAELPSETAAVVRMTRADLRLLRRMNWDPDRTAREFDRYEPFMAVIEDGAAVSLCHSARLTDRVAEAGVETLEAYRGRGYAARVVAGWARIIRANGLIPLYSTSWENHVSQVVAQRLGLVQYAADLSLG